MIFYFSHIQYVDFIKCTSRHQQEMAFSGRAAVASPAVSPVEDIRLVSSSRVVSALLLFFGASICWSALRVHDKHVHCTRIPVHICLSLSLSLDSCDANAFCSTAPPTALH